MRKNEKIGTIQIEKMLEGLGYDLHSGRNSEIAGSDGFDSEIL